MVKTKQAKSPSQLVTFQMTFNYMVIIDPVFLLQDNKYQIDIASVQSMEVTLSAGIQQQKQVIKKLINYRAERSHTYIQ